MDLPGLEILPEVVDFFIDQLLEKSALTKCSLVCKAWLPRCRFHLFSNKLLHRRLVRVGQTHQPSSSNLPILGAQT